VLIGELAEASGATTKTLRFYEKAGLLPAPERTAAGYRDYHTQTLPRLDFIRRGRAAGLSLTHIREVLEIRDGGSPPCRHVHDLLGRRLADLERQISDLQALHDTLADLRDAATTMDPGSCDPTTICRYL
jgi:DNA-binding transcriptional MerR regulator